MASARCPTCRRLFDTEATPAMPFCSERCRQIDLARWIDERNSITVERSPDEFEEDQTDGGA